MIAACDLHFVTSAFSPDENDNWNYRQSVPGPSPSALLSLLGCALDLSPSQTLERLGSVQAGAALVWFGGMVRAGEQAVMLKEAKNPKPWESQDLQPTLSCTETHFAPTYRIVIDTPDEDAARIVGAVLRPAHPLCAGRRENGCCGAEYVGDGFKPASSRDLPACSFAGPAWGEHVLTRRCRLWDDKRKPVRIVVASWALRPTRVDRDVAGWQDAAGGFIPALLPAPDSA
jgi:hypothetical protein